MVFFEFSGSNSHWKVEKVRDLETPSIPPVLDRKFGPKQMVWVDEAPMPTEFPTPELPDVTPGLSPQLALVAKPYER